MPDLSRRRALALAIAGASYMAYDQATGQFSNGLPALTGPNLNDRFGKAERFTQRGAGALDRLVREKAGERVSVRDFCSIADGNTDNTSELAGGLSQLAQAGGGEIVVPVGYSLAISSGITIPENVWITGQAWQRGGQQPADLSAASCRIVQTANATVTLSSNSGLRKLALFRDNLVWGSTYAQVLANFGGTAVATPDSVMDLGLEELLIVGFGLAFGCPGGSTNISRMRLRSVYMDCINGLQIEGSRDISTIRDCHYWPYATYRSASEANNQQISRPGFAYQLSGFNDHTRMLDCFEYGAAVGYRVTNGDVMSLINCGADHQVGTAAANTAVGFQISGNLAHLTLAFCKSSGQSKGLTWDTSASPYSDGQVIGFTAFENNTYAVQVTGGRPTFIGGVLRNTGPGGQGLVNQANGANDLCTVDGTAIQGFTYGIANSGKIRVRAPKYLGNTTNYVGAYVPQVASAATLAMPDDYAVYAITGTTDISGISAPAWTVGEVKTLEFSTAINLAASASLSLKGPLRTQNGTRLYLTWDGTTAVEVARQFDASIPFTPVAAFTTAGDFAPTYTVQNGRYWYEGRRLCFFGRVLFNANAYTTASGAFRIGGLPFSTNPDAVYTPAEVTGWANITLSSGFTQITAEVRDDGTLTFRQNGSGQIATEIGTGNIPASRANVEIVFGGYVLLG